MPALVLSGERYFIMVVSVIAVFLLDNLFMNISNLRASWYHSLRSFMFGRPIKDKNTPMFLTEELTNVSFRS